MGAAVDPIDLTQALIRCPSVTPADAGALDVLQAALEGLGFVCRRLPFGGDDGPDDENARVDNLYARLGTAQPNFCFAGHTDVVPPGDLGDWRIDPFAPEIRDGELIGRGASDMKGAIAAFVAAAGRFIAESADFSGSISLLITGDEEGIAVNGTKRVLNWMRENGEAIDHCVVGEPTNPEKMGQMIKVGRRGSMNFDLAVTGDGGHVAYPHLASNPAHAIAAIVQALTGEPIDDGSDHFQPSNLQVTSIDVGNPATNVIPARATAKLNVRFNDLHTSDDIKAWVIERIEAHKGKLATDLKVHVSGESFLTPPGKLSELLSAAAEAEFGRTPELSTSGGTSDARFIKDHCPVAEFGLVGLTMHKIDERVAVADIEALTRVYTRVLNGYFGRP